LEGYLELGERLCPNAFEVDARIGALHNVLDLTLEQLGISPFNFRSLHLGIKAVAQLELKL